MKKNTTEKKPLNLNVETLRVLEGQELEGVVGGWIPTVGCQVKTIIGSFNGNCCGGKAH